MDEAVGSSFVPVLLHSQEDHRSEQVPSHNNIMGGKTLACRRADKGFSFSKKKSVDVRLMRYLYEAGFYGLYHVGYMKLDRNLITALVERWRPKTHTFHFRPGECTVTLQDIEILGGVRIDGEPVTGTDIDLKLSDWQKLVERLLGKCPGPADLDGSKIKISWLDKNFGELPSDASDETVKCHTRAIIILLLGGQYISDKSNSHASLLYLPLLEDLSVCGRYSWGSAILAYLYRRLCEASLPNVEQICGPLLILQMWAWMRLPQIRPMTLSLPECPAIPPPADGGSSLPAYPYGYRVRMASRHNVNGVVKNNLRWFRDQFDQMHDDQITWEPYKSDMPNLPDYCKAGQDIWLARVPLIYYNVIEHHYPDRVLRQFGKEQNIPDPTLPADELNKLHKLKRYGTRKNWEDVHKKYVEKWRNRHDYIVQAEESRVPLSGSDSVMKWYRNNPLQPILPLVPRPPPQGFQPLAGKLQMLALALAHCRDIIATDKTCDKKATLEYIDSTFRDVGLDRASYSMDPTPNSDPQLLIQKRDETLAKKQNEEKKGEGGNPTKKLRNEDGASIPSSFESVSMSKPTGSPSIDVDNEEEQAEETPGDSVPTRETRPIGRKTAKANAKGSSSTTHSPVMVDLLEKMDVNTEVDRERMTVAKEMARAMTVKEDRHIMMLDADAPGITEAKKKWILKKQAEVMAKDEIEL